MSDTRETLEVSGYLTIFMEKLGLIVEKLDFIIYNKKRIGGNVYGKERN